MEAVLTSVNHFIWGAAALVMILGTGLLFTFRSRFLQIRLLPKSILAVGKRLHEPGSSGVSSFAALCTALGATVGIGNIAGVAGAVCLGGPGAVFWMLLSGLLGMGLKYAEVVLAMRYRADGKGGPMYYLSRGLGAENLAKLYCIFGVIAAFGVGNAAQISTAIGSIDSSLQSLNRSFPPWVRPVLGLSVGILICIVLTGGAKRIGAAAELLVPFAAGAYCLLALGAIVTNRSNLLLALRSILVGAFQPSAVTGGLIGSAALSLRFGVSRGVFTNEAGMGTSSIAHACTDGDSPEEQGLLGIFEVFADTMVICLLTALVILTAPISLPYGVPSAAELTIQAFSCTYGTWVTAFLSGILALFAFATVLGWGLYGIRCGSYLWGHRFFRWYPWLSGCAAFLGAMLSNRLLWTFSEAVNGLMAIPNLWGVLRLMDEVTLSNKKP